MNTPGMPKLTMTLAELPEWIERVIQNINNPVFNYSPADVANALQNMLKVLAETPQDAALASPAIPPGYDRELIARMLFDYSNISGGRYEAQSARKQAQLISEADNATGEAVTVNRSPAPSAGVGADFHARFQRAANVICASYRRETGREMLLSLAEQLAYDALKAVEALQPPAAPSVLPAGEGGFPELPTPAHPTHSLGPLYSAAQMLWYAARYRREADKATVEAAVDRPGNLPELPEPHWEYATDSGSSWSYYTAEQMRTYGEQCRLATTEQPGSVPDAETMRLHMGELSTDEVRIAQAAYRWAMSGSAVQGEVAGTVKYSDGMRTIVDMEKEGLPVGTKLYATPPPAPAAEQGDCLRQCNTDPEGCACKKAQPEARGVEGICKGTNCSASKENGHRHSSECLFDHARAVASGVESFALGITLNDDISYVDWRGQRIDLAAASAAAQASVAGVFSQMSIGGDPVFPTTEKSP